jgi:3-phenylpropionate/trans-cinnamate dioxygenase ferredoxin reductase subunit
MMPGGHVVVGAGPAGLATVRGYRQAGGAEAITLVGAEDHVPYQRPPLTKEYLRGGLDRDELWLETESWFREHSVQLRLGDEVEEIDAESGAIRLSGGERLAADSCVLTTGSRPQRPPFDGADHDEVLQMRTVSDGERLGRRAESSSRAIVIGSGFIGCEAAASLAMRGLQVTLISQERLPQATRLGAQAGERLAAWLREANVDLILDVDVEAIEDARRVCIADGRHVEADVVLLATGVAPNGELAGGMGVELHDGAVPVNASMRSANPFLRAAGDVAWAVNSGAGRRLRVEHWGDALGQGEVAGRALAGEHAEWEAVPGFWSTIGERTLKYAAWGDGYDDSTFVEHEGGAFTVRYTRNGVAAGVLTHQRDDDYEQGRELIASGGML